MQYQDEQWHAAQDMTARVLALNVAGSLRDGLDAAGIEEALLIASYSPNRSRRIAAQVVADIERWAQEENDD